MENRNLSLDFLRGASIFGMIFSAIVPSAVLPAWMYHIQNPPPSHQLDTSISGIGWVDLVFPVFIFCMGVAIPLSGQKKIEQGISTVRYIKGVLERAFMLWLFSYLYILLNFSTAEGVWPQIFTILGFFALFPLYQSFGKSQDIFTCLGIGFKKLWMYRCLGVLLVLGVIVVGHFEFGEVINVHRRGIIIFLLAFLYLFGSLIWYFTRNRRDVRWVLFALLIIFVHITRILDWPAITYANPNVRWWFNMEYFYFLLVLVPATFVGDMLCGERWKSILEQNLFMRNKTAHIFFPALALFVVWQCVALYLNLLYWNIVVSAIFAISGSLLAGRISKELRLLFLGASLLVLCALFFIPIEGGISKVPCTIAYCLATPGISIMLFVFSIWLCHFCNKSFFVQLFAGAGKNPLMSYIIFGNLLMPLLEATGAITLYRAMYFGECHIAGVVRAFIMVLLSMWIAAFFSKKNIYWKA